jgi:hypothetical protein
VRSTHTLADLDEAQGVASTDILPGEGGATTALPRRRRSKVSPSRGHLRQRVDIRRRSRFTRLPPLIDPSEALATLMRDGEFYDVHGASYLVARVDDDLIDSLIVATGANEDDEASLSGGQPPFSGSVVDGELGADDEGEPSLGQPGEDRESDGLDDEVGHPCGGGDVALGWANEGSQAHLSYGFGGDEAEPELGWANTGPQIIPRSTDQPYAEGDGDCDAEEDDPPGGAIDDEPHDDDQEGDIDAVIGPKEQRLIAEARERYQAKRPTSWTDPSNGDVYNLSYDGPSGCRIETLVPPAKGSVA